MSSDRAVMTAQGRNAPCPCGSGRRFKHCCGRAGGAPVALPTPHYPGWEAYSPDERAALWRTMQEALTAQKGGQFDTARELYGEVVARAPLTFDAVHMLGVVHLQQGDLDAAEALLVRALEMMPGVEAIRQNLQLVRHRKREHEGLYSLRAIVATDMLRLFGATAGLAAPSPPTGFFAAPFGERGGAVHVVVPGDVLNAAANASGVALARQLHGVALASLWTDPQGDVPMTTLEGATAIDVDEGRMPSGGTLAVFGVNARTLDWLPAAAGSFDSVVVGLDAHDPEVCVGLFDRLPPDALPRIRLVARCPELLADLGLPGAVDPMVFGAARADATGPVARGGRPRIGVFVPAIREREDKIRWETVEWLRAQGAFLRVLYPGTIPSRHIENEEEHLISLVTEWEAWWRDLDALFYWGAEGRMRQYDRLVFEAMAADLAVVAGGYGDYAALAAERPNCALFFDAATARDAVAGVLSFLRSGGARARASS